ncbi:MAG: hypothetical protein WBL93_09740 [Lutisporaceae bacterium]
MILFVISLVTGFIAMNIAGVLNTNDTWVLIISFLGFVLPYAIVLERVYKEKTRL